MKTLTSAVTTPAAASQSAWTEIYDVYLKAVIATPQGNVSVLRLTQCPGGFSFFTPLFSPEPAGTQGNNQTYQYWPMKRQIAKASTRFTNDKMSLAASNVTGDWATMLGAVDWHDTPVVIRKVPLNATGLTSADCAVLFSGTIDSAKVTGDQIQFIISNDLGTFSRMEPFESMHTSCSAQWGDDLCGMLRFLPANYKSKTCGAGSTTSLINSAGLTEDTAVNRYVNQACTISTGSGTVGFSGTNNVNAGDVVYFGGTTLPTFSATDTTSLVLYAINCTQAGFQVALTPGGPAIAFSTAGSGVTVTQANINGNPAAVFYTGQAVTLSTVTNFVSVTGGGSIVTNGQPVYLGGSTLPTFVPVLSVSTPFIASNSFSTHFKVNLQPNTAPLGFATAGSGVTFSTGPLYGVDLIENLSSGAITASSSQTGYEPYRVQMQYLPTDHWRFSTTPSNPTTSVNTTAPYLVFDLGSAKKPDNWSLTNGPTADVDYSVGRVISWYGSSDNASWILVFQGTEGGTGNGRNGGGSLAYNPATGVFTVVIPTPQAFRYWKVVVTKQNGAPFFGAPLGKVTAQIGSAADLINALSTGAITASDQVTGFEGYRVQSGQSSYWSIGAPAASTYGVMDWGVNYQGYWQIPDNQAGLANPLLRPYIQFDFGSGTAVCVWRFQSIPQVPLKDMPRVLLIFSSNDPTFATGVKLESYYQCPARPGQMTDCLIPTASANRYWRICVRNTWDNMVDYIMFCKIRAYTAPRNWWATGRITFAGNTTTAALQNQSRAITESYGGQIVTVAFPVAPVAGDTFTIERRCPRTFNACCERQNQGAFRGFTTMPDQTVIV